MSCVSPVFSVDRVPSRKDKDSANGHYAHINTSSIETIINDLNNSDLKLRSLDSFIPNMDLPHPLSHTHHKHSRVWYPCEASTQEWKQEDSEL